MQPDSIEFWIDMNLPPVLASWITTEYHFNAFTFDQLNFKELPDFEVFKKASINSNIIVVTTKDYDFVEMTSLPGSLPKVLYLNIGNVTNKQLREIFDTHFSEAIKILSKTNQQLVEITNEL